MDKIVKTEAVIEDEEIIIRVITIKNEPGTLVEPGTEEVTVQPEHGHNMSTSFWSLTRGPSIKTEHPLINQTLVKANDEMTVTYKCEQDVRLNKFTNTSNGEDTSSVRDSKGYTSTLWLMDKDAKQDKMIKAESEQHSGVIKTESDHGLVDQESELLISDVQTASTPASLLVNQANIGDNPFKCRVCGKSFTQNSHLINHSQLQPFKCEVCGKSFTYKSVLNKHCFIHRGERTFMCHICGKSFNLMYQFTQHSLIHTGEKPVKSEVFAHNSHLRQHSNIHTCEKPFKCQVCGKSYCWNSGLIYHSRIHTV